MSARSLGRVLKEGKLELTFTRWSVCQVITREGAFHTKESVRNQSHGKLRQTPRRVHLEKEWRHVSLTEEEKKGTWKSIGSSFENEWRENEGRHFLSCLLKQH